MVWQLMPLANIGTAFANRVYEQSYLRWGIKGMVSRLDSDVYWLVLFHQGKIEYMEVKEVSLEVAKLMLENEMRIRYLLDKEGLR